MQEHMTVTLQQIPAQQFVANKLTQQQKFNCLHMF